MEQLHLLPARKLSVVVPCYNEAENVPELVRRIRAACAGIDHELILVNDGSTDATAARLREAAREPGVGMISFTRNAGHQNAIRAGLLRACGDRVVILAPSHRFAYRGVAICEADAFETPLGRVEIDAVPGWRPPFLRCDPQPFEDEHSLEIQLPFVQRSAAS